MTLRKGLIDRGRLGREWPHHVALSAEKVRGLKNSETVRSFANARIWRSARSGGCPFCALYHAREVMQGIRRKHGRPPDEKEAVLGDDIIRMIETLGRDLRGLRDRAILLLGFAGGFRRSEIVGLDCGPDQTKDGSGWIEILRHGRVITKEPGVDRLNDKHIVRLVKRTALAAGVRGDLSEADRRRKFAGHSLRAGLATSTNADEYQVQQQLGHASVTMTRRYQRKRTRFRLNLTKAAGL